MYVDIHIYIYTYMCTCIHIYVDIDVCVFNYASAEFLWVTVWVPALSLRVSPMDPIS